MKLSENAKEWIRDIVTAVIIAAVILAFIQPTIVQEHSMENTLHNNDYLFVSKRTYTWFGKDVQRGDIIVFRSDLTTTDGKEKPLIKRVIAVAGDTISISGGNVILNGEILDEPYIKDGYTASSMSEITVPEGYVFCMGDNRQNSADSRDSRIGCVPISDIKGKAIFRLFPFSDFGSIY